jgi:2-aminoadipate transaminase
MIINWLINDGYKDLQMDRIAIITGAKQGLDLVCRAYSKPGDTVLTSSPTYMNGLKILWAAGLNTVGVPLDEEGIDPNYVETILRSSKRQNQLPAFIYTIPDFHNPTGTVMSSQRRADLINLAEKYDIWVVEDNPYRFLRIEGETVPSLSSFDEKQRVISIGSFAKLLGPGLRVGWVVADTDTIDTLLSFKADGGSSPFIQMVIEKYFDEIDLNTHLKRSIDVYRVKRDTMEESLSEFMPNSVSWIQPNGGYYFWLSIDGVNTDQLCEEAFQLGVKAYQGSVFFPESKPPTGSQIPNSFIRLAFAYETPERIVSGVRILSTLIKGKE